MKFRKVDVPEGKSGDWAVGRFTTTAGDIALFNLRQPTRMMSEGTFTQLTHHKGVIMSDTPAEIHDLHPLGQRLCGQHLCGKVLLNGLGLGVSLQGALDTPEVEHITVIELSQDVIDLVAEHYIAQNPERVSIIQADAMTWKHPSGVRYDVVWHDIWTDICGDNWESMKALHRKYGHHCNWQGSWCRDEVRAANKILRKSLTSD